MSSWNTADKIFTENLVSLSDIPQSQALVIRGREVKEYIGYNYSVDMNSPIIFNKARKMNYRFMFGEAYWIASGCNRVSVITNFMKSYSQYSDDGVFLHGAYGPKIVDQLPYIIKAFTKDLYTRQAVLNIWRESPGDSKDIPCTLNMQFFVRKNKLISKVNMRSQDAVWGYSYDVFSFTTVANCVRLLLNEALGLELELGDLEMSVGSFHIYKEFYDSSKEYIRCTELDDKAEQVKLHYNTLIETTKTYDDFVNGLADLAMTAF